MSGSPRCFGVFGDPVAHSKSPAMHAAAFHALGLEHHYLPFHVRPPDLADALKGAVALGFGGLSLTVPHKVTAVDLVARLGMEAARIGAVNTVVFRPSGVEGHNTDGRGFVRALEELPGEAPGRVLVLGAGGASRAVVDAVVHTYPNCVVDWVSRRPEAIVVGDRVRGLGYEAMAAASDPVDVLVNGTTVGMAGGAAHFPAPPPLGRMAAGARVVDLVYPRPVGGLLDAAASLGIQGQDGRPTLLWQGVFGLELWLEREIPVAVVQAMRAAL